MATGRKLNSDQLGQKGEARFRELCNDAQLIANKADYDRSGWDFIVEFPFDTPVGSFDKRGAPLSCHVQVKTMWSHNNAFLARLSSIERLAKEPKPSFIYVLKIDEDLQPESAFLIPLLDDVLAKVLRQLRAATAEGRTRLNQRQVRFVVPPERMIATSGKALRAALIEACGPDLDGAIQRKSEQLKSLGFEANAFQAETTLILEDENEIADVLLGLKPAPVKKFQLFEERFGIRLPIPNANGSGLMHIKPEPVDRCQLVVRGAGFSVPGSISAEIIVPPLRLDESKVKYLIRSTLLDIEVTQRGAQLSTKPERLKSAKLPLAEWTSFFRMMTIFSSGAATLEVVPARLASATMTMKIEGFPDHEQNARILRAFDSVEALFRLAGMESPPVLLDEILPAATRYTAVAELFSGSNDVQQLSFKASWPHPKIPNEIDALYIDAIQVAGVKLAFSCIATMFHETSGDGEARVLSWKSRAIKGREVTAIRDYFGDYEKFAERSKIQAGIDTVMMATYDEAGPKPG